jgi:hypothetical protein
LRAIAVYVNVLPLIPHALFAAGEKIVSIKGLRKSLGADCKTVYAGSIPAVASTSFPFQNAVEVLPAQPVPGAVSDCCPRTPVEGNIVLCTMIMLLCGKSRYFNCYTSIY